MLLAAASSVLISSHPQVSRYHRRQTVALGAAAGVPWACNALYVLGDVTVDWTTVGFPVTAVVLWAAFGRWGLLTASPVARSLVVEHLRDPVVVVDSAGRVAHCNPAASAVLPTGAVSAPG